MNLSSISSGAGGSGIISNSPTAGSGGNFHNTFSDQRGKERSNPNSGGNEKSDLRSTLAATHLPPPPPSSLFDRNEQDDRLWYLALSFSLVMTNENKSFDIYKALSRMENSYFKKSYVTEILEKLIEKDLKITGKYGKLYCNEKGRWIYKQERMFLKSSSLRFLGQGIHQMKRSFRTLSIEEPSPVSKSTLEEVEEEKSPGKPPKADAKMLRRFSTTDARFPSFDAPETPSPESARTLASDNQSTQPSPGPTVRSPPSRRKSISARSVLTLSDGSASINIDQLYSPRDEVLYGANLPLIEQSEIIFEILLEELLPAMTIYESFFLLGAAWLGDGSSTSVAASQRRLLQKVNSRTAILNTTNLIDQLKHDRSGQAVLPSGQISPRITLSRTPSNASLGSSNELKNVRTIDTDLLNELLNDIEENAMINMPDIVEPTQLEKPRSKSNSLVDMTATSRERTTSASKNDHHFSIPKLADVTKELTRLESFTSNADTESRSKDRDSSTTQGTPRDGEETHATKSIRFAPSVPLKRPSWNSPTTPIHFARKRRPGMVVRLALSENGPFQKILTEGVRVVIHYLLQNERRPRRIQRVMMLQDGRPRNKSWQSDSFDINDYICSDSPTNKKNILKLKFFKFEAGVLIETNDEIEVNSISEILTGVHTSVFKKSLNQLFGENSSYEKSGTEKRCFSLIGCISPFDERHCLDIEIQPVDKQKPEVLPTLLSLSLMKFRNYKLHR